MAFNTALSGLRAANADLSITGNNIANASTVGFKNSRAEFGDIYATTVLGSGSNTIGSGVRLQNVAQQFSQGNVSFTENALDLAISGGGFFVLSNGGDQVFSRAGTLGLDKDGFIVNNIGATLQGFQADTNGVVSGVLGDLQIQTGNQPPRQTTLVESALNLDATEAVLQRSGTTFTTAGNAIGVSQVGQVNDTTSSLIAGTFNLPLLNNFNDTELSFDIQLSGATANNGTVSVVLNNAAGMPASVNTFNDLRTMAGVINSQLFSPSVNTSQDPIDVVAVAVDDGGGDFHMEFQALVPGEASQVLATNGNDESQAVSAQAATSFSTISAASPVDFSSIDPPAPAVAAATTTLTAGNIAVAAGAGASTMTLNVNGTSATIDLEAAAVATGGGDVNALVTEINTAIGLSGLAGQVQAVNNSAPATAGTIRFETVADGANQTLEVSAITGNDFLGLATPLGQINSGSNGATFDISINGASPQTVTLGNIGNPTPITSLAALETAIDTVLDTAVGAGLVNAQIDATTGRVYFQSVNDGADNTIQVTSVDGTDILGLQGASGSPNLVNSLYRGGDASTVIGIPVGGGSISDSSGQAAVNNAYPTQSIDVVDPDGNSITYTSAVGNSAAQTASEMNALAGVSATATTMARLSAYGNANGNGVLTLNNVGLTGDTLSELETQINALSTSTLPGVTAVYDAATDTLDITSAVGDDLTFEFSSTDDGDNITLQGDPATVPTTLESDPLNDGTSTATLAQTPSGNTVFTGTESYWGAVPAPSFDISIDGQGFVTVDLGNINSDLINNATTPVAGTLASNAGVLGTPMTTTFNLTIAAGTSNVDLNGFVDGTVTTPAALQTQVQAAVDAVAGPGNIVVNLNPRTNELSFSDALSPGTIVLDTVVGTDPLGLTAIETAMGGVPDAGAAVTPANILPAIQTAIDNAIGAGQVTASLDASNQLFFEAALPGINHSLRITNVTNDVLGLTTVPNLVGGLYQGDDGLNNRAEGVNGNPSAVVIGGAMDIVLDEGYSVTSPNPPAIGLFEPFTATTFTPFVINQFDPNDQGTYNHATSVTVYDSLGNSHIATQYFVKQPYDVADPTTSQNHWLMYALVDGADVGDPNTTLPPPENTLPTRASYNLFFNQDGTFNELTSDEILVSNWTPLDADGQPNGALGSQNQLQGGTIPIPEPATSSNFQIDLDGTSQFGSDFAINDVDQNGFTTGRLSGISIDDAGLIFARFTNGEAQTLGQIALAEFANVQGLQPVGDTMWAENFESGVPNIGSPGTAALGVIQAGAVEESNVDLSGQLVNLIIAQRNFQANAKTIETANQTTQTIINLR